MENYSIVSEAFFSLSARRFPYFAALLAIGVGCAPDTRPSPAGSPPREMLDGCTFVDEPGSLPATLPAPQARCRGRLA